MSKRQQDEQSDIAIKNREKLSPPRLYKVIMHNDDFTTMEFVIYILKNFFHKKQEHAEQIMLEIHQKGQAVCGIYSLEVAKTKVRQVTEMAKKEQFPLRLTYEQE